MNIDPRRIVWKRVLDINDRALREVIVGLGGPAKGVPRQEEFMITVASEIMAVLCLSDSLVNLKVRLSRMVVAYTYEQLPITVKDLGFEGALTLLLNQAMKPNLVQTIENTPAIIHGGPFANIAHGCNSVVATKLAAKLGDYVVTEAGFGADLGAEKFMNIKARAGKIEPDVVVIVATIRALKLHGGLPKSDLNEENLPSLKNGVVNLKKHIETIQQFGIPFVVAINQFPSDTYPEINYLKEWCKKQGIEASVADVFKNGGAGAEELANIAVSASKAKQQPVVHTYKLTDKLEEKILKIAQRVYGADGISFTGAAKKQLDQLKAMGYDDLPVCMAKTQYSLSDDPSLIGWPQGFTVTIRDLKVSAGAGFIVVLTGNVMTMPGLPKKPAALNMDITNKGQIKGLF